MTAGSYRFAVRDEEDGTSTLVIESIGRKWRMELAADDFSAATAVAFMQDGDETSVKWLETYASMCYMSAETIPDVQFVKEFIASYNSLVERLSADRPEDDESEADILAGEAMLEKYRREGGKDLKDI